jgi:hypothetical protein
MWAQPWAWIGLAGLAVPIAIHLLARHQAVLAVFPTLRFINASQLNAIKRQRLTDIPLLLIRLATIALAVAALAGPRFGSASVSTDEEAARVTVYDMTASAASGRTDSFVEGPRLRRANVLADSLSEGLKAASAWAARQSGQREITVVSDFQRGSVDDAAVGSVPPGIGLTFERVRSTPSPMPAGFSRDGDQARMVWPHTAPAPGAIRVLAGPDQPRADAMLAAAMSVAPALPGSHAGAVAVIFPRAPERAAIVDALTPVKETWMFRAVEVLLRDARLASHVRIGEASSGLIVLCDANPETLEAAEVVAALSTGLDEITPSVESDTRLILDEQLRRWERPAERAAVTRAGEPQGRWLWIGVIALLAIETGMRRRAA